MSSGINNASPTTMEAEAVMICIDTSSWMDSTESLRFKDQLEAIELYCAEKINSHSENVVGLCGMGHRCINHLIAPDRKLSRIINAAVNRVTVGGYLRLIEAVDYAHSIWFGCSGTELGTHLRKRIVVFAGGPVYDEKGDAQLLGKAMKNRNLACDAINFGDPDRNKKELFDTLIAAADNNGNCNVVHVPPESSICDALLRSRIIPRVGGSSSSPLSSLSVLEDSANQKEKAAASLSENFVYLRDNLLSSLYGIEILKWVKVLDLSFNDFKGPGFEPLEACKVLQQLYLAGNQITSLASLPALPSLEFLSVAQTNLKSLAMASQPRLQVLAASKNKVSTLKGFPCLPAPEHLRLEENPILEMAHVEAASVLLVGPTLKKFNDRDLPPKEITLAKHYPAHTAVCIAEGWELCSSKQAIESTFNFLVEQWKDQFPSGYMLKEASIDQPFEEDACNCHVCFAKDSIINDDAELVLNYQWFVGSTTLSNFAAIPDATTEVYWPKHHDVGKILKVECTPVLGDTKYSPIFAISSRVYPAPPKVTNLEIIGDLKEGSKVTVTANITGATEGLSRVQWFKTFSSILDGENGLVAVTSKFA